MFLLMFLFAPVVGLISTFGLGIEPWPVGLVVAFFGVGGVLRIIYALMFESKNPRVLPDAIGGRGLQAASSDFATSALPPKRDLTASEYASPRSGGWIETETQEPASVTDNTTKLLEKEPER